MRKVLVLIAIFLCLPVTAQEGEPPLPKPRPAELSTETPASAGIRPAWTEVELPVKPLVPMPRPRPDAKTETPAAPKAGPETPPDDHIAAPETPAAPRVYQVACPAVLLSRVEAEALPPSAGPPAAERQCGAQSPLSLTGVLANGRMVPVSGGVTTDCGVASALPGWIEAVDSYLMGRENTRIAEVIVGTSYMCRNVNNADAGNLSFHAFADALDVVGFKLEDGRTVTVEGGWADALSAEGRLLRYAHDAACSHFTTVLGPEANALHHDHFHVDLGCHGKTCTARLCE
jgi:hypothetical protein